MRAAKFTKNLACLITLAKMNGGRKIDDIYSSIFEFFTSLLSRKRQKERNIPF